MLSLSQHASITGRRRWIQSGKEGKKARNVLYAAEDDAHRLHLHIYHIFPFPVSPFIPGSCLFRWAGSVSYSNADNLPTKSHLIFWKHAAKDPGNYGSGAPGWMVEAVPCCFLRCVLAADALDKHSLQHESPPGRENIKALAKWEVAGTYQYFLFTN